MARLAITGIGIVTSVGSAARPAAAAIRAGIVRPTPLVATFSDPEDLEDTPLTGHAIAGLTDGFEGASALSMLASHAVKELLDGLAKAPPSSDAWQRVALYVSLSRYRSHELSFVSDAMREEVGRNVVRSTRLPLPPQSLFAVQEEHASVLVAAQEAARAIEARQFVRAILVGVDTLVKDVDLDWLGAKHRLKTPDDPTGLEPGEGAGAILLEAEDEARRRKANVLAWLDSVHLAQEEHSRADGHRGTGRALAEAIRGALGRRKTVGTVFVDLNGEEARAFEWGTALARLAATHELPAAPETIASSIGDTGAASGAIQLVCATQALVRGYAKGDACLVCSSADSGKVGAALLTRASPEAAR